MERKGEDVKKYHGYLALPRHAILLQQDLGYRLFGIYTALVMNARWDRRNPDFGRVVGTQVEIATYLGLSQPTLSRCLEKLSLAGYTINRTRYITLKYFPLFLNDVAKKMHASNYANLNELYSDMYRINAELHENYAKLQEKRTQNPRQSVYPSSNDNLSFPNNEIDVDEVDRGIEEARKGRG